MLALTGWTFNVQPVDIDESPQPGEDPSDYVLRLAESKALAAKKYADPGQVVLAADTTVADGKRILGKPESADEAFEMLRSLRGRAHWVYTAIGVYDPQSERLLTDLCGTRVWMRNYSDEEIEAYIASGDPFDKAGAYAIQNSGFHPVERIEGCFACVVGLGLCSVVRTLRQFGLTPPTDITHECQEHLETECLVYPYLLGEDHVDQGQADQDQADRNQAGKSQQGSHFEGKET